MIRDNENHKPFRNAVLKVCNWQHCFVYFITLSVLFISLFLFSSSLVEVNGQSQYGYDKGCDDAKITEPDNRYISKPGKGVGYHSDSFMSGYYDGFNDCYDADDYPASSNSTNGIFKIIVEVTNNSFNDKYGDIIVSVDQDRGNFTKSEYSTYFPAKETTSKAFAFKSDDVPIGTEFKVDINYGEEESQSASGENTPAQRAELVQFSIR